jgi:hypothetical protein
MWIGWQRRGRRRWMVHRARGTARNQESRGNRNHPPNHAQPHRVLLTEVTPGPHGNQRPLRDRKGVGRNEACMKPGSPHSFWAAAGSGSCGPAAVRVRRICARATLSSRLDPEASSGSWRSPFAGSVGPLEPGSGCVSPAWCRWPAPVGRGVWGQHTWHGVCQHPCWPGLAVAGWSVRGNEARRRSGGDERVRGCDGYWAPG